MAQRDSTSHRARVTLAPGFDEKFGVADLLRVMRLDSIDELPLELHRLLEARGKLHLDSCQLGLNQFETLLLTQKLGPEFLNIALPGRLLRRVSLSRSLTQLSCCGIVSSLRWVILIQSFHAVRSAV